jgi:hypothetical protein
MRTGTGSSIGLYENRDRIQHRAWQRFTVRLLTWFLGWVHSLMPPNGLLVKILRIPTLGTVLPFNTSNNFTITC